ncbi:MAG: universal stress protein [Deltaproteobacteria bacterium HGW-Deltaproteobacteria-19]|jgi:nucleotide-binding universal stress UspA family protein|nr:MAG: universal stress protein [Deltaproteobacteria bacterium HGW-Deltaproteobacteria-19]
MFAPKNILVPTDFSEHSDRALKQAIDLASRFNAKVYLLHVIEDLQQCAVDYCLSENVMEGYRAQSQQATAEKLGQEVKAIGEAKGVEVVFDIKRGVPYETILREQEDKGIDLIVIASHGKTGLLHNLLGGVAERVVRAAKCQVLLVK